MGRKDETSKRIRGGPASTPGFSEVTYMSPHVCSVPSAASSSARLNTCHRARLVFYFRSLPGLSGVKRLEPDAFPTCCIDHFHPNFGRILSCERATNGFVVSNDVASPAGGKNPLVHLPYVRTSLSHVHSLGCALTR